MSEIKKHKPLILIVVDLLQSCKMITHVLNNNYVTVVKTNGSEAIKFMQNDEPNLVLLNIEIPEIDALTVCNWIRNKPSLEDTPVIIISSQKGKDIKTKTFKPGGVGYLTTPFEPEELMDMVQIHLSLQSVKSELKRKNSILEQKINEINVKKEQLKEKDLQLLNMDEIASIAIQSARMSHEINIPLSFIKEKIGSVEKDMTRMIKAIKYWENMPLSGELLSLYKEFLSMLNFDSLTSTQYEKFSMINVAIEKIMLILKDLKNFLMVDNTEVSSIDINKSTSKALDILRNNKMIR